MYFDNEQQINIQNNELECELEEDMAFFGYSTYETDFFETKDYEKLLLEFAKNKLLRQHNFNLKPKTIKQIRKQANNFIKVKTEGIDRNVLFLDDDDRVIYNFIAKHGDIDESKYDKLIKFILKNASKKDITLVPIKWVTDDQTNGYSMIKNSIIDDIEFLEKHPIISCGIVLANQNDDLGSAVLVHEMTHSLIDRHKGIIENRLHNEILSIYMELLSANELDKSGKLLNYALLDRLQSLKSNILSLNLNSFNGYKDIENQTYTDSALYAFNLFENYITASDKSRKSITKEINKTLSGDRLLEETLEKLDITEEEGSHIIRGYVKKLMK